MIRIIVFLLCLVGTAYGQSSPTSAKTRFVNGLYMGTKLDSYFGVADSNAIYWRADSVVMAKYKGTARALAFASALGSYKLIADTFFTAGYTTRARTKQQIDSLAATKLSPSDSATYFNQVVRTFGTQTVGGTKSFSGILNLSSDLIFQGTNNNKIEWNGEDGVIYTNGGSYLTLGSSGNASNLIFDRSAARWGLGTAAPTATFDVNGTAKATTLQQTSVTSALLKASGTGVLEAAVAGTDYVAPGALSGYLPLTGGTLTGALSGTTSAMNSYAATYNAGAGLGSLAVGRWLTQPESSTITRTYFTGPDASTYGRWEIYRSTSTTPAIIHQYNADGSQQMYGALNGTSAAFSGGVSTAGAFTSIVSTADAQQIRIRMSGTDGVLDVTRNSGTTPNLIFGIDAVEKMRLSQGGRLLINTTTDNGTDALQVAGSVLASGRVRIGGGYIADAVGGNNIGIVFGAAGILSSDGAPNLTPKNLGSSTYRWDGIFAQTGDFSSSVTANSFVKSGGTSSQALIADGSVQTLTSGTYTPTLTNTTNISSSTASVSSYTRIGNIVTVYAVASATTSAAGQAELTFSVPIATTAANAVVVGAGIDSIRFPINNGSSGTTVGVRWTATSGTATNINVIFQYTVN